MLTLVNMQDHTMYTVSQKSLHEWLAITLTYTNIDVHERILRHCVFFVFHKH